MTDTQEAFRTVALTGGTGFVGGHILDRLCAKSWRVKALSRRAGQLDRADGSVTGITGTLGSSDALDALVSDADIIIHCAGLLSASRSQDFHTANAEGTANLVRAVLASARQPRFILVSSLAAREADLSPYAASKHAGEQVLQRLGAALPWSIVRPPAVYGPGDRATLMLFRQLAKGIGLLPNARGRFSMIYVEDLADAIVALASSPHGQGQILEVDDGTPEGYSWSEVAAIAERSLGQRVRTFVIPKPIQHLISAAGAVTNALTGRPPMLSEGKIRELAHDDWICRDHPLGDVIGWQPKVDFARGFAKTLAWYKAEGWI